MWPRQLGIEKRWISSVNVGESSALFALFCTAFLSATVFPFPSEGALITFYYAYPNREAISVFVATLGNTLGGMTTYGLGRISRRYSPKQVQFSTQVFNSLHRFGPRALLLSWLPVVGDALSGIAGWLEFSWWRCLLWMALGKGLRYLVVIVVYSKLNTP